MDMVISGNVENMNRNVRPRLVIVYFIYFSELTMIVVVQ